MKKIISIIVTFSMIMSMLLCNVSAINLNNERELERARLESIIYAQLAEQDALYLSDHFDALIDSMLDSKYGITPFSLNVSYYAPNGGWIKGTGTHIEVEGVFYNVEDTQTLYENRNEDVSYFEELLVGLFLGLTGWFGDLLTLSAVAQAATREAQWSNIELGKEGCYFYAVYDSWEDRTTTVIIPWTPPYMKLNSTITVTDYYVEPY